MPTITLELSDNLANRIAAAGIAPEQVNQFTVSAILDALDAIEPAAPEEQAECVAAVEAALSEMDVGQGLLSFDAVVRQWEADTAERLARRSTTPKP